MEQLARPVSFRMGLYEALRRTAVAQHEAVRTDDLDSFYALLQERERLLDKTEAVQQELDESDRLRAASVVKEIMVLDQETERLLAGKIEEARDELGDMSAGKRALAGYGYVTAVNSIADWRG